MMNSSIARSIVGIIGNVISFGFPTFFQIIKNKSVEEFKPDPYLATKKIMLFLLVETIFFAFIVLVTMLALQGTNERSLVVGVICDVFNVMMYVSPLTVMAKVIKTKSVKYMPFWLSLANFLNGVCWTTYALIHPLDIYVLVSNGIGAISRLIQLILYACYCTYKDENEDNDLKLTKVVV
ncbi:hypothetical protein RJT34_07648 [Clitoria ternatea]|uniref:Uncharacterized protein n=1 Tax=Clitoria ternatea TaxID=43366 RepID=A0AAN9PTM4_CLITE